MWVGHACREVIAGRSGVLLDAGSGDHDVVATFGVVVVVTGLADEDVVAGLVGVVEEQRAAVALHEVRLIAALHPVVTAVTLSNVFALALDHEVVTRTAEAGVDVGAAIHEVLAVATQEDVEARSCFHCVVAGAALEDVVTRVVGDDVVAVTTEHMVSAVAPFDDVVARVSTERVVVDAAEDPVDAGRAVVDALAVDAGRVDGVGGPVPDRAVGHPDEQCVLVTRGRRVVIDGVGADEREVSELEFAVCGGERIGLEGMGGRVAHDKLGERVALELRPQVHARGAGEVVQPVGVLQVGELVLEDVVEGRAEETAEQVRSLGEATDPKVDIVEARGLSRPCAQFVEEVPSVCGRSVRGHRVHDEACCLALSDDRRHTGDAGVCAVGRDEVDERLRVLEVQAEVDPVCVRLELRVAGRRVELTAKLVQRWDALAACAGHVDRRKVERQTQQVVAQGLGHELVDLVADLVGHPHQDGARRLLGAERAGRAAIPVRGWVQEPVQQWDVVGRSVLVDAGDVLGQHRVAEAVDRVRELRLDGRVDVGLSECKAGERVDERLHLASELLEHQVLVLHLGHEPGCLEHALTLGERRRRGCVVVRKQSRVCGVVERRRHVIDKTVVLGVEDLVDCRQRDVLVEPTVAADGVKVEQLVVILAGRDRVQAAAGRVVGVRDLVDFRGCRVVVVVELVRDRGVRDVVQECDLEVRDVCGRCDRSRDVALEEGSVRQDVLREPACRTRDEVAVQVGGDHRNVEDVLVTERQAKHVACLCFDLCPVRLAAVRAADQLAGRNRLACRQRVLTQEHLMGRVRRVRLALVHERCVGVARVLDVVEAGVRRGRVGVAQNAVRARLVGRPGQRHEPLACGQVVSRLVRGGVGVVVEDVVRACDERVVRPQRDEHRAAAALGRLVDTVVEELAEDRKQSVERRREADVRGHVRDEERVESGRAGRGVVVGPLGRCPEERARDGARTGNDRQLGHVGSCEGALERDRHGGRQRPTGDGDVASADGRQASEGRLDHRRGGVRRQAAGRLPTELDRERRARCSRQLLDLIDRGDRGDLRGPNRGGRDVLVH